MVQLTKLHDEAIVVNADLIEFVESTPDTLISMTTGKKLMVKETVEDVVQKVVEYRRRCLPLERKGGARRS
jgi:flagellar protein FlbD